MLNKVLQKDVLTSISPTCFNLIQTHHNMPKVKSIYKDNLKSIAHGTLLPASPAITLLNRTQIMQKAGFIMAQFAVWGDALCSTVPKTDIQTHRRESQTEEVTTKPKMPCKTCT